MDGYFFRKRKGRLARFQAKNCSVPEDVRLASVRNHISNVSKMSSNYRRYQSNSDGEDKIDVDSRYNGRRI
ncbi:hypothetical protein TNCV_1247061 [Trichonephila clavipes]|uniref:Uncharacterized protein n=1 Tax=Trichonephila clavipes TaxID=2585209 RepID=A0A8X6USW3_TRICX|nr:hypothetical protein TNCV_1247061 [Trichonephila clavipes]